MLDLNSLLIVASLLFGLVVGDAALFGDTLQVQVSVPPKLVQDGFTEAAAEQQFAAEVGRLAQTPSPAPTPHVQMSYRPTVLAALAKPLNLDGVVAALQGQFGIDIVTINGAILADDASKKLELIMVVTVPSQTPLKINLSQPDGNARALVERGARQVLERITPFRLVVADLTDGLRGDTQAMTQARETAARAVNEQWLPSQASERVMLRDILGILALIDSNIPGAEEQFQLADAIPRSLPAPYGVIALNRAFVAVAQRHGTDAQAFFDTGAKLTAHAPLPGWQARLDMLHALVAWSNGDTVQAEQLLRSAAAALPDDDAPHMYLAQLLAARGDAAGAAEQQMLATEGHRSEIELAPLAQSLFMVDPVNGGMRPRF